MNNPLFKTYAKIVNAFFATGRRIGEPIVVFAGQHKKKKRGPSDAKQLSQLANEAELQSIQSVVDEFRAALIKDKGANKLGRNANQSPKSGGRDDDNIHAHLQAFQAAIESGNEANLDGNPFYELTKLVFHLNTNSAGNLFASMESDLISHPPEPVYILKSLREIWFTGSGLSLGGKIHATMNNWIASG